MGAKEEQERIAAIAGVTANQAITMSGADLHQQALLTRGGQTAGPGKDGARLAQLGGGSKV